MLKVHETELVGQWFMSGRQVVADAICRRIENLTTTVLEHVANGDWSVLYRDPTDGRLWEKTSPQSHLHGGGPAALTCISSEEARVRYGSSSNVVLDSDANRRRST
ncbi:hypothetical protein E4K72_19785 [Oxalobacteraceae bacterium OM1]|nr:hypothetical protein E4K72_19785 [Oxalobacteraceae bacterium OM1]